MFRKRRVQVWIKSSIYIKIKTIYELKKLKTVELALYDISVELWIIFKILDLESVLTDLRWFSSRNRHSQIITWVPLLYITRTYKLRAWILKALLSRVSYQLVSILKLKMVEQIHLLVVPRKWYLWSYDPSSSQHSKPQMSHQYNSVFVPKLKLTLTDHWKSNKTICHNSGGSHQS